MLCPLGVMDKQLRFIFVAIIAAKLTEGADHSYKKSSVCGAYGFTCFANHKLRLCDNDALYGPTFLCPDNTICNEDSSDVCENAFSYIPTSKKTGVNRCRRYERIADITIPNCKGYILCIPNKNKFQGVKFKCAGSTIFNGKTRTCSSPDMYKCPQTNSSVQHAVEASVETDEDEANDFVNTQVTRNRAHQATRPIDCKNYKFSVRQDSNTIRKVAYFCPSRPVKGEVFTKCTVFSNNFCLTLQKEEDDQFLMETRRKPRKRIPQTLLDIVAN